MANLGTTFNTVDNKEVANLLPAPAQYKVAITRNQITDKKDANGNVAGKNLRFEMDVQEGQYAGRKLFDTLGIEQPDADKQAKARGRLTSICNAVGKPSITDGDELMGIPFTVSVIVTEGKNGYQDQNYITKYHPKDGAQAPAQPAASTGNWGQ